MTQGQFNAIFGILVIFAVFGAVQLSILAGGTTTRIALAVEELLRQRAERRKRDIFDDNSEDKILGAARSGRWPTVRDAFLKNKRCAVCGSLKDLVAHHILPFHLFPDYELDPKNLIALCERPKVLNCHLIVAHFGSWRRYNPNVVEEAREWNSKLCIVTQQP